MAQTLWNGMPEWLVSNDFDRVRIEHAAACRGTVQEFVRISEAYSNLQSV